MWCWRWVVPTDLRGVLGAREVSRSLGTASKREAVAASLPLRLFAFQTVARLRSGVTMDDEQLRLSRLLRKAQAAVSRHLVAEVRDEAETQLAETLLAARVGQADAEARHRDQLAAVTGAAVSASRAPVGPALSEAVATYLRERAAMGAGSEKTQAKLAVPLRLLCEALRDPPITEVSRGALVGFLERLQRMPSNVSKRPELAGLTFDQLTEVSADFGQVLADETVNGHMTRVSGLFKWAQQKQDYGLTMNPAAGLVLAKPKRSERLGFRVEQLVALFSHSSWRAREFMHPHYYWLMPMAALSGMRLNELCQLRLVDFDVVDGVDVIRCAAEGGKTEAATRWVPVHLELARLGLLRQVERLRAAGETQLFPELKAGRDGHGQQASKWFQRYRKACGVTGKQVHVFHSFRHGFVTAALKAGVAPHRLASVVGHEAGLVTVDTYGAEAVPTAIARQVVEAVKLPPEVLSLIPPVEEVKFTKRPSLPPSRLGARKSRERRVADAAKRKARPGGSEGQKQNR